MRQKIQKLGRVKLVIIITLVSLFMALVSDVLIAKLLGHNIKWSEDLVRAGIIPLLIAPVISWYLVGFLFELDRLEQKMSALATYDDLTGLFNRRAFYKACEYIHKYSMRNKQSYCLLIIDIDHFKKINDVYGHATGDEVLAAFGQVSKEISRSSDILGRLGGEEFGFFLPNTSIKQAEKYAKRLRKRIKASAVTGANKDIQYTVSAGIAINLCNQSLSVEDVMKHADHALYSAKNNGRNQVAVFTP